MSKVPPLNFRREDIPDLSTGERTDRLLRGLNAFGKGTEDALNQGLTFAENFAAFAKVVEFTTLEEWVALTPTSPWTADSPTPQIRKRGMRVELRGALARNTATSGSAIFTIASQYRSDRAYRFATSAIGANPEVHSLLVPTTGVCTATFTNTPAAVYLDGVAFDATDSTGGTNGVFPLRIKNELGEKPSHAWVTAAVDFTTSTEVPVTLGPLAWSVSRDQIVIHDIGGVLANRKYRCTILVVSE